MIKYAYPAFPNVSYNVTFWMKTQANSGAATTGAQMLVVERNASGGTVTSHSSTGITSTTDWTFYSVKFTSNASAIYLTFEPRVVGNNGTATLVMDAWFDNIIVSHISRSLA
jgi:hypothetical protein